MPITYQIDPDAHLVRTTATGVVVDADLQAHEDQLAADPAFEPALAQLVDGRHIERLAVSAEGIQQFVTHEGRHAERFANHRVAILADENVVYGMARMYQTLSGLNVGVFRTLHEAMAFLESAGDPRR